MRASAAVGLLASLLAFSSSAGDWGLELDVWAGTEFSDDRVVTRGSFDELPLLSTADAGGGVSPGGRLRVSRRSAAGATWRLEAWTIHHSARASVRSEDSELDPVFGPSGDYRTDDFDFAWRHELRRAERFTRVAAGRRRDRGAFHWSVDLTLTRRDSQLELLSTDAPPGSQREGFGHYAARVRDTSIGLEAGVGWTWSFSTRWSLGASGGLGLAAGGARKRIRLENDGAVQLAAGQTASGLGWTSSLELLVRRTWAERVHLRFGWTLHALGGVADAPSLLPRDGSIAEFARIDRGQVALEPGLFLGLGVKF